MESVRSFLGLEGDVSGQGVLVSIIDSGVDHTHPDLSEAVVSRSNCVDAHDDPGDLNDHGSHLAAIVAGRGRENPRLRGIAPAARVHSHRVHPADGRIPEEVVGIAIWEAIDRGADILLLAHNSIPLDPRTWDPDRPRYLPPPWIWAAEQALDEPLEAATLEYGILCVLAAGNAGDARGTVIKPAGSPHALSVGATDNDAKKHPSSSRGPYVVDPSMRRAEVDTWAPGSSPGAEIHLHRPHLVAPGVGIQSAHSTTCERGNAHRGVCSCGLYVTRTGTSQAAAVVAGLAACAVELLRRAGHWDHPGRAMILRSLLCRAAAASPSPDLHASGAGVLRWAQLRTELDRYVASPSYRADVQTWAVEQVETELHQLRSGGS